MRTEELINKTLTNIYSLVKMEVGGLDTGECFIELDNEIIIDIPFGFSDDIWIKDLDEDAVRLFADLSDYPVYHVNKDNKTVGEIVGRFVTANGTIIEESELEKALYAQLMKKPVQLGNSFVSGSHIISITPHYHKHTGWYDWYEPSTGDDWLQIERDCPDYKGVIELYKQRVHKLLYVVFDHHSKHYP